MIGFVSLEVDLLLIALLSKTLTFRDWMHTLDSDPAKRRVKLA